MDSIVILGSGGMLGSDVVSAFSARGCPVVGFDQPAWDITRHDARQEAIAAGDVIINCAAYTDVDGAESNQQLATSVNGEAVGELGLLAAAAGRRVVHFSTDFVFDGTKEDPYIEDDAPCPISVYGHSKLLGESMLAASGCDYLTVRLQWTYGRHGENFFTRLLKWAETRDVLQVVDDQIGSPTATVDVAETVCELVEKSAGGTLHYAASEYGSRYEIAAFAMATLAPACSIVPCGSDAFKS
ncbi:MAG TPA: dTDP-4-dehydrorhamnose reductase, partial [Lentisphaeria bacterium]|nr:dTDP-4-dehydrorhamnose reductase [Lentisphaeria bacterium]